MDGDRTSGIDGYVASPIFLDVHPSWKVGITTIWKKLLCVCVWNMPQLYCSWTLYNQLLTRMHSKNPMNKPVNRTQHEVAGTQSISHQVNFQIFCSQVNKCFDVFGVFLMIYLCHIYIYTTGWWFQTFFTFPYIGNNQPNWLIFFGGVETTNQYIYI